MSRLNPLSELIEPMRRLEGAIGALRVDVEPVSVLPAMARDEAASRASAAKMVKEAAAMRAAVIEIADELRAVRGELSRVAELLERSLSGPAGEPSS